MNRLTRLIAAAALALVPLKSLPAQGEVLRLATTTSVENSGLLRELLPAFERRTGIRVDTIAVGTGKALRLGRDGDVDVLLVHAPAAEHGFMEAGHGSRRRVLMTNHYVFVGPAGDPLHLADSDSATEFLAAVADARARFISRGDESGTHGREKALWKKAGIAPKGDWYIRAGQGMGAVLRMAHELSAYTLTDHGTWLAFRSQLPNLQLAWSAGEDLLNTYSVIVINPERHEGLNHQAAVRFSEWLARPEATSLMENFTVDGEVLFHPVEAEDKRGD